MYFHKKIKFLCTSNVMRTKNSDFCARQLLIQFTIAESAGYLVKQ